LLPEKKVTDRIVSTAPYRVAVAPLVLRSLAISLGVVVLAMGPAFIGHGATT
jgi:hypothetical protein